MDVHLHDPSPESCRPLALTRPPERSPVSSAAQPPRDPDDHHNSDHRAGRTGHGGGSATMACAGGQPHCRIHVPARLGGGVLSLVLPLVDASSGGLTELWPLYGVSVGCAPCSGAGRCTPRRGRQPLTPRRVQKGSHRRAWPRASAHRGVPSALIRWLPARRRTALPSRLLAARLVSPRSPAGREDVSSSTSGILTAGRRATRWARR